MSNSIQEASQVSAEVFQLCTPLAAQNVGRLLTGGVVQLGERVSFKDIFAGTIAIGPETKVYDRHLQLLDTSELISQIDSQN